ncbi:MAG: hypothetical protein ACOC9P_00505 [bacterium]
MWDERAAGEIRLAHATGERYGQCSTGFISMTHTRTNMTCMSDRITNGWCKLGATLVQTLIMRVLQAIEEQTEIEFRNKGFFKTLSIRIEQTACA